MNPRNRRRFLQAMLAGSVLDWRAVAAQAPGRTLVAAPRSPAAQLASEAAVLTAPRRALVIGNGGYAVGALKNPANDARAIAGELERQGFEVSLGLELKKDEMLAAIGAYAESIARTKAVALFYFAGHGLQLSWRNYLVPVEARVERPEDIKARCVDVNAVIEGIARAANPMNMIILDACRDNPFGREARGEAKGLSQLDAPPGTLLAYATSPGNIASDGDGANGLYTEHLLREMRVPEAQIEDVFKRVRLGVRRRSHGQQIPWESTSLEQDFWFIPPKEVLRQAQEEAARVQREQEAERRRQEQMEQARKEEQERVRKERLARLEREQEAERARIEEEARLRREQAERARQEEIERLYNAELELWERIAEAKDAALFEDYLRRYPSGHFAELAQLRLDRLLAAQGEKKIEVVSQPQNPYTAGAARSDVAFQVGDSYVYAHLDRDTREERRRTTATVIEVNENEVVFDRGLILDRLGNTIQSGGGGRRFTARQDLPLDYAIGKKWSTRFSTLGRQGGSSRSYFDFKVTRRETISVPAGTFECFLVEGEGYAINQNNFRIRLGLKRWMAPGRLRRPVAAEQFRVVERRIGPAPTLFRKGKAPGGPSGILNDERMELVSFRQA